MDRLSSPFSDPPESGIAFHAYDIMVGYLLFAVVFIVVEWYQRMQKRDSLGPIPQTNELQWNR